MATSETNNRQDAAAAATRRAAETRIDVAHQAKPDVTLDEAAQPQPIAKGAEAADAQVRTQAVQLAEHLRTRQKDLDHREAELHARVAQFENDMSAARLWLSERMAELQEQKQHPDEEQVRREEALKKTAAQLGSRQKQIEAAETRLAEQQAQTRKLQERLAARRQAIDREEGERREHSSRRSADGCRPSWRSSAAPSPAAASSWTAAGPRWSSSAASLGNCTARRWRFAWRPRSYGCSFPGWRRRPP